MSIEDPLISDLSTEMLQVLPLSVRPKSLDSSYHRGHSKRRPSRLERGKSVRSMRSQDTLSTSLSSIGSTISISSYSPRSTFQNDDSHHRRHRKDKDVPTSKRAHYHLQRHGDAKFGRIYAVYPESLSFQEAREVIGDAYAGTTDDALVANNALTRWMLRPLHVEGDKLSALGRCAVGLPIHDTLSRGGVLFGIRGEDDGQLKSSLVFREIDPIHNTKRGVLKKLTSLASHMCPHLEFSGALSSSSEPVTDGSSRPTMDFCHDYILRTEHLEDKLMEWHSQHGPREKKHWYISDVAVTPSAQGTGYGTEMMKALLQLADRYGVECYLECADDPTFFHKFGFHIVARETLDSSMSDEDPGGCNDSNLCVYIMIRDPEKEGCRPPRRNRHGGSWMGEATCA